MLRERFLVLHLELFGQRFVAKRLAIDGDPVGGVLDRKVPLDAHLGPQPIDRVTELEQALDFVLLDRLRPLLAPLADAVAVVGQQFLYDCVAVKGRHAVRWQQEVVDGALRSRRQLPALGAKARARRAVHRHARWRERQPVGIVLGVAAEQVLLEEHLAARADQRVAGCEAKAKPRALAALVHRAEPQRGLAELDGRRIEVDAVAVAGREARLHAALVALVVGRRDALAGLFLNALQVGVGELVDGFEQECATAHRGLADRELEDLRRGELLALYCAGLVFCMQQLLEAVVDEALRQHFGRVEARGLLAVATGESVEERALFVDQLWSVHAAHDLAVVIVLDARRRHEPRRERFWRAAVGLRELLAVGDLVEIVLREEAGVGQQGLVDRAELVDAELRVRDAAARRLAVALLAQ